MKVAIFTDTYLPNTNGVAVSISQIKDGLEKKGHEVYIFCQKSRKKTLEEKNIYRSSAVKFNKKIDSEIVFPNRKIIEKIIEEFKPDIIHTHTEFSMSIIAKKISKKYNIPMVHTTHTIWDYYLHYLGFVKNFISIDKIIRKLYKGMRHFIYPSHNIKDRYFPLAEEGSDFRVIRNGINLDVFIKELSKEKKEEIYRKYNINENDKIILFVGRLNKEKNINLLVENLKDLLVKNKNYKFMVIGQGREEIEMRKFIAQHALEEQVIFVGILPWSEMYYYYKIADVFVSLSISETSPMTAIEALAASSPVVLVNNNNRIYDDVIENGQNGYLIEKPEEGHLYVEKIIKDDKILEEFKKNAEKKAINLSSTTFVKKIEDYYEEIISKKKIRID